jgi:hypothetical protein
MALKREGVFLITGRLGRRGARRLDRGGVLVQREERQIRLRRKQGKARQDKARQGKARQDKSTRSLSLDRSFVSGAPGRPEPA